METILDHNITDKEKEYIGCTSLNPLELNEQANNYFLAMLFYSRGDKVKAEKYADKLPAQDKVDFYRLVTHP
ncbi:MAG: hypothetical protein AB7E36_14830 [Salinivirgaceae bacterium]